MDFNIHCCGSRVLVQVLLSVSAILLMSLRELRESANRLVKPQSATTGGGTFLVLSATQ